MFSLGAGGIVVIARRSLVEREVGKEIGREHPLCIVPEIESVLVLGRITGPGKRGPWGIAIRDTEGFITTHRPWPETLMRVRFVPIAVPKPLISGPIVQGEYELIEMEPIVDKKP